MKNKYIVSQCNENYQNIFEAKISILNYIACFELIHNNVIHITLNVQISFKLYHLFLNKIMHKYFVTLPNMFTMLYIDQNRISGQK